MVHFLAAVGKTSHADDVIDAAVAWGAGLAANMRLPEPALTPAHPRLPLSLRLLLDRLDCPSRMVQERAASSVAALLAADETREETSTALLDWHAAEALEARSCMLLLVLLLARSAHGISDETCMAIVRPDDLIPSLGLNVLLREFGAEGQLYAELLEYRKRHSGQPTAGFSRIADFNEIVDAHLAPIFRQWAKEWDDEGMPFSLQWEWEAAALAEQVGLALAAKDIYHFRGSFKIPTLPISDRVSCLLRSAYLRALHWCIDEHGLGVDRAEFQTFRIAPMADPMLWAVRPSVRPAWWPAYPGKSGGKERLGEVVGKTVSEYLEGADPIGEEVLLFAAGPVGADPRVSVQLIIQAFLQSAQGALRPTVEELVGMPRVICRPIPSRLTVPGSYITFTEYSRQLGDWLVAPLVWTLQPETQDWLMPGRQSRGLHVPAAWLFAGSPSINTAVDRVTLTLGDESIGHYRFWHDELCERSFPGAGSRVGGELFVRRQWLAPHISSGAALCWSVTLIFAERGEYEHSFDHPPSIARWLVGGSRIVWPKPWRPP
ncbi:hypothetical protein [Nannocystis punicea]|uniref:Uncharacterized protein n=1 Tax=Nannocystis punicea TaxID=2995304 RepID=A0ABY7GYA5_9BACT|nr:hypothetical protein [Nannocystis poenicansa]WAS91936.1 hypothetical protein O0S08_37615 [Nannocystis poenicansa]